ncbi:MAG: NADH-quinone oxidoreductase subunit N [Acidobacteria bacterium]|nr:MAG: NADH-quinone oxidoreductase subunit N [Acidobacteriota bacterium]
MSPSAITAIVPILCVTAAGLAAMLAEAFREPGEKMPISGLGLVGLAGAAISAGLLWGRNATGFGVVTADTFGLFVVMILVVIGVMTLLLSPRPVAQDGLPGGEFYALTLFALAGMMLMAMATDLLVIFLALEVMSLAVYVLTAIRRESAASVEGGFKYFILGGFSSAFFLYGIAFVYGIAHTTRLDRLGSALAGEAAAHPTLAMVALGLLLVGFAFKVSAVPFHMWTPDAYEGAPTIVAGFMSTGVKAAAFAAFVRVMVSGFEPLRAEWFPVIWGMAAATMILGTVVGVAQTNLKRMLAYSSIAHAGFILVGLAAGNDTGRGAILFYLLAYGVTNLAAFGVLALLATKERANDDLDSMAGLSVRHPALAAAFAVLLLSLGGLPPTAGFVGKWYVFSAAMRAGHHGLAIIGVLTSVVSIFFYLRVIVMMYMAEPGDAPRSPQPSRAAVFALATALVVTFYLGVMPAQALDLALRSVGSLF